MNRFGVDGVTDLMYLVSFLHFVQKYLLVAKVGYPVVTGDHVGACVEGALDGVPLGEAVEGASDGAKEGKLVKP